MYKFVIVSNREELIDQIHVNDFERLDFTRLDPSLAIGFYLRDRGEFEEWFAEVKLNNANKVQCGLVPLFHVDTIAPSYHTSSYSYNDDDDDDDDDDIRSSDPVRTVGEEYVGYDDTEDDIQELDDEDEYVILPDFK